MRASTSSQTGALASAPSCWVADVGRPPGDRQLDRLDHNGAASVHLESAQAREHRVRRAAQHVALDGVPVRVARPARKHDQVQHTRIAGQQRDGLLGQVRRADHAEVDHVCSGLSGGLRGRSGRNRHGPRGRGAPTMVGCGGAGEPIEPSVLTTAVWTSPDPHWAIAASVMGSSVVRSAEASDTDTVH